MINLYSGTPGSGKSLHLARDVADALVYRKKTVIANFPVNLSLLDKNGKRKIGKFIYRPNHEITVPFLLEYAQEHHKVGVEGQTLLVIDEAGIMFNSRDYASVERKAWINFFMTHRHFGYNVILVSQFDRMLDRQVRAFIEYEIKHRKANNYKLIGLFLTLFHIPVFVAVTYWYGMKERCSSELFRYRKRDSKLYDTMMLFGGDKHGKRIGEADVSSASASSSPPSAPATDGAGDAGSAGGDPAPSVA